MENFMGENFKKNIILRKKNKRLNKKKKAENKSINAHFPFNNIYDYF